MTSLASVLLSNLVIACLLAMIATLVGWSGRRATVAHWLWVAVFVKLITPPIVLAPVNLPSAWSRQVELAEHILRADLPFDSQTQAASRAPASETPTSGEGAGMEPLDRSLAVSTAKADSWPRFSIGFCLIAVWLMGGLALVVRGVLRFLGFSKLLRREGVFEAEGSEVVRQLLGRAPDAFSPPVCRIRARISPMLFGMGRATWIVCPDSLWTSLDESRRHSFLAHEVAHYQRRDHWVRWLEWIVTAIYWWLPLIYLARLQLERHEEAACDAWALGRLKSSPRNYAETLLSVVDFLSESRTAVPRLASRMQPTAALEERLRLIMRWQPPGSTAKQHWLFGACCVVLVMVHPTPLRSHTGRQAQPSSVPEQVAVAQEQDHGWLIDGEPHGLPRTPLADLPAPPAGWWNAAPGRTWADQVLGENELHLLARVGIGIGVSQPGRQPFTFDPRDVRALAYVVPSGRLVIGTSAGEVHLWDAKAHQSVSLLGKHSASITSIAFHPKGKLISGDATGTLISWEIGSGQMLATRSFEGPIGSVRWSNDGSELAVLVGDWTSREPTHHLQLLDARQFETLQALELPTTIAVVPHDAHRGWLAIDWTGEVWSLTEARVVDKLEKRLVSGTVMCQDLFPVKSPTGPNDQMASPSP